MSCGAQVVGAQLGHTWDPMWMDAAFLGRLFSWGPSFPLGVLQPSGRTFSCPGIWAPALTSLLSLDQAGRISGGGVYVCACRGWGGWEETWMRREEGRQEAAGWTAHGSLTMSLVPLCPQALLLLGLNPISAFLQDQHCESLSPASNVSGEYPDSAPARVQPCHLPQPITCPHQDSHTEPCPRAGAAEISSLGSRQFLSQGGSAVLKRILKL